MRVALMRTGTVLFSDNHKASPTAGNQDALGVLRYLKEHHDVCVFGMARGDFGCEVFSPDFSHCNEWSAWEEFEEPILKEVDRLAAWQPDVAINIIGSCPSVSCEDNPWGVRSQLWCKRTVAPSLFAIDALELPRVCVINDPRSYPKDHEIHYKQVTPVCFLSQEDYSFHRTIRGKKFLVVGAYAGAENWWTYGREPDWGNNDKGAIVLAHKHGREEIWNAVLAGKDVRAVGKGWSSWVRHDQVSGILRDYTCGPVLPIRNQFVTGKIREFALSGCMPLPVSMHGWVYDSQCRYFEKDNPWRIRGDWSVRRDEGVLKELLAKTTPDFSSLEQAIAGDYSGLGGLYATGR